MSGVWPAANGSSVAAGSGGIAAPWHRRGCSEAPDPPNRRVRLQQEKVDLCAGGRLHLAIDVKVFHSRWVGIRPVAN
jgi:hypothetical protein